MIYGFFQCCDGFFYIFTFLPIRILIALFKIITSPFAIYRRYLIRLSLKFLELFLTIRLTVKIAFLEAKK
jgi:hypothetical protein